MKIEARPSPNFNDRKHPVDMLVLHYTGMETGQAALDRMCNADAEVSAHYMVWEDGRIVQMVGEDKRAWHAGVSSWQGDSDLNSRSIGIEIVNGGHDWPLAGGVLPPYPDAQIEAVIELCQDILSRWDIPIARIVGHSDIAPDRKDDPGEHFPWDKLSSAGVGHWPLSISDISEMHADNIAASQLQKEPDLIGRGLGKGDKGSSVSRFQGMLSEIGYALDKTGTYDRKTVAVVRAFQRRWVQDRVTGEADLATLSIIARVHALYKGAKA